MADVLGSSFYVLVIAGGQVEVAGPLAETTAHQAATFLAGLQMTSVVALWNGYCSSAPGNLQVIKGTVNGVSA